MLLPDDFWGGAVSWLYQYFATEQAQHGGSKKLRPVKLVRSVQIRKTTTQTVFINHRSDLPASNPEH